MATKYEYFTKLRIRISYIRTFFVFRSPSGFTLLEMLVSIGIFSVLIISSIAIILSIGDAQVKTSNVQNIQDNLRYTMELIARELRQGKDYCQGPDNPCDCSGDSCEKVKFTKFEEASEVPVWYCLVDNNGIGEIRRWKQESDACEGGDAEVLTANEIDVQNLRFIIFGEEPATCDSATWVQPRVTITMGGRSVDPKTELETEFRLQTTVTQRIRKIVPDPDAC